MSRESKVEKRRSFIINTIYFAIIIGIVYIALKYALGLFMPFIVGLIVASLLKPAIKILSDKLQIPKKIVALVLVLLFYSAAGSLLFWIGIRVFTLLKEGIVRLPEIYSTTVEPSIFHLFESVKEIIARLDPSMVQAVESMATSLSQSLGTIVSDISSRVIVVISSIVSYMPGLFLAIIFSIISSLFISMDYSTITGYLIGLLSPKHQDLLFEVRSFTSGIIVKYAKAFATLMFITFVELSLGLSILRVEGAIGIAALIAVIDIMPVLGTGGVLIPWAIIALIRGQTPFAIGLIILYVIVTVIRNILEPKIVGEQIGLHPVVMLMCIYVGVKLLGFIGLFLLPFTIIIAKHLYENNFLAETKEDTV